METIQGIGGLAFGFWFSRFLSDPLMVKNRLPVIRVSLIEFLPNFKIRLQKYIVHIHHWMFLSIVFGFLLVISSSFSHLLLVKSLCLGSIIQGFTFKDRFRIVSRV